MRRPAEPAVCRGSLCAGHLRQLSVMLQDTWGTDITKGSWGVQSWGQRLNTEAAYPIFPGLPEEPLKCLPGFWMNLVHICCRIHWAQMPARAAGARSRAARA